MREIELKNKLICIVDDKDYEEISKYKWHPIRSHRVLYAARTSGRKTVYMHREILGLPRSAGEIFVDHINKDGLDNRRKNLRTATRSENKMNGSVYKNNSSGYRGVHFVKRSGRWEAYIYINNKKLHCGFYSDPKSAAAARDVAAKTHHAEYAYINITMGEQE